MKSDLAVLAEAVAALCMTSVGHQAHQAAAYERARLIVNAIGRRSYLEAEIAAKQAELADLTAADPQSPPPKS